jgi:hypothetical protein
VIGIVVVAVGAAVAGLLRGGSLGALATTEARGLWLVYAALVLQVGAQIWSPVWLTSSAAAAVVVASNLIIALFLAANRKLPGAWVAIAGLLLNVVVIAANGAMPVAEGAVNAPVVVDEGALKHEPMTGDTVFPWLGDVLPLPIVREIWSAGDVLLAAGIATLVYARTTASNRVSD